MEENNIDVLEEKINKIVAMINTLREENKKLKVYAEELQKSNMEKDEVIRKLNQERENIANIQNEIESYKSKHDRVRTKVDQLLLKLKEIDDIY